MSQIMPFLAGLYTGCLIWALVQLRRWQPAKPFSRLIPLVHGVGHFSPAPHESISMNKQFRFIRRLAPVAALSAAAGSAMAAVPADVTTAVGDLKADGVAVATAILLALVAIYAIKFIRKGF